MKHAASLPGDGEFSQKRGPTWTLILRCYTYGACIRVLTGEPMQARQAKSLQ
jgi:nitrite reductase/ring-hydroxylating ferredoxin subunit